MPAGGISGVSKVEVSADGGGTWGEAALYAGPTPMAWTIWGWEWSPPSPGQYTLMARATDGNGNMQVKAEGVLAGVFPSGTTGMHQIVVKVTS